MVAGKNVVYALSGFVRREGEADDSLNRLATKDGRESCSIPGSRARRRAASDLTFGPHADSLGVFSAPQRLQVNRSIG